MKNSHCSYCGIKFTEQTVYPRRCFQCYNYCYNNPLPITVVLIDVWDRDKDMVGTLVQKRNIEPKKGHWALTGGYMENGETWQEASAREVFEEIGLETLPNDYSLIDVKTSISNGNLLIFGKLNYSITNGALWDVFKPNNEVSEIKVIFDPEELAFPSHTEIVAKHLNPEPPAYLKK